jgi:hypothetical protein
MDNKQIEPIFTIEDLQHRVADRLVKLKVRPEKLDDIESIIVCFEILCEEINAIRNEMRRKL